MLSPSIFQLPIPPIFFLVPPSHPAQWVLRGGFLLWSLCVALPLMILLVPLSLVLSTALDRPIGLALHPDNTPPRVGFLTAVRRGYLVYTISTLIWAVTSLGNAPDLSDDVGRRSARLSLRFVELFTSVGMPGKLVYREEIAAPIEEMHRIGVMQEGQIRPLTIFSIARDGQASYLPADDKASMDESVGLVKSGRQDEPDGREDHGERSSARKAILFLAGGGYVTGTPLAHPFVFSLARRFPPDQEYTTYAPCVRKSLDKERSFPIPLLDALAAYAHVRKTYAAEDITIMGDSAGGGLCWSLAAYLAVIQAEGLGGLGVPGGVVLISPWLALPPTTDSPYPDFVDLPQLLNAARCYMARYPILRHRPDPFSSDLSIWSTAARQSADAVLARIPAFKRQRRRSSSSHTSDMPSKQISAFASLASPASLPNKAAPLSAWFEPALFHQLSSAHPLVSPASDPNSTFVPRVLGLLAENDTRILLHVGTAEWFHDPAIEFAAAVRRAGVDLRVQEEKGGQHSESCIMPAELGGRSARLVEGILGWIR